MTIVEGTLPALPEALLRRRWMLSWSSSVTSWTDPFGVCGGNGKRHGAARLVVAVELGGSDHARIEAWIEPSANRHAVLAPCNLPCATFFDGRMLHVDVLRGEAALLTMSIDVREDRLLYARTTLLEDAGRGAGRFDPARLEAPGST